MISQTALATKLRRADNQPLGCVLTLHDTSDIYKVSISLIATRQQLAKVHQIDAPDGTWCHQAPAGQAGGPPRDGLRFFFVLSYFLGFLLISLANIKKSPDPKNIDLNLNPKQ